MHELSLCQSAVEIIQQQAEQHGVARVTGVWLEIGALSCVEERAVRFSFDIACQGTLAQRVRIAHRLQTGPGLVLGLQSGGGNSQA